MPSTPDYCPFCGARLAMDESLDAHLETNEECAASFREWRPGGAEPASTDDSLVSAHPVWTATTMVVLTAVLAYALLIRGSVLLAVIASVIVYTLARAGLALLG